MRRTSRFLFQRACDDRLDFVVCDFAWLARPWRIAQPGEPLRHEPLPPFADRRQRHLVALRDGRVAQPAGTIQYNPGAQRRPLIRLRPPRHRRKFCGFFRTQH
jgi:hypothetical protein